MIRQKYALIGGRTVSRRGAIFLPNVGTIFRDVVNVAVGHIFQQQVRAIDHFSCTYGRSRQKSPARALIDT